MTVLKPWIFYFELTLYFDVFTKQILSWKLSDRRGGREQYLDGLSDVIELLNGSREPTIFIPTKALYIHLKHTTS